MDQENPTAFEPNNEIFAAPLDRTDAFPSKLGRHRVRVVRTDEARVVDSDAIEAAADERGRELSTNALHLR